jgi:ligand-binding SRPBCC domain-containing protein
MRIHVLETDIRLASPRDEVFPFFADAMNLQQITPPFLDFRILTPPPIRMEAGTLIDYSLKLRGIPIRWRTRIAGWDPPFSFVDEQVRGPYRLWVHEHRFLEEDEGTRVLDRVRYAVPGGALVHRLLVRREVERIFAYRTERLRERFGGPV